MCIGAGPALGLGLGLLQGVTQYAGQMQQYEAQEEQYEANFENAKRSTFDRYQAINTRVVQENAAKSQELQEAGIEGIKARGSARTAAAESGVSGISVSNVLGDMYAREGRFVRNTNVNFDYSRDYWKSEGASAQAQGQNQVNSVERGTKPSLFGTMLDIFGQSLSTMSQYNQAE